MSTCFTQEHLLFDGICECLCHLSIICLYVILLLSLCYVLSEFLNIINGPFRFDCDYTAAAKSLQSRPTLRLQRRQPTRLPRPWDSPDKNTGVGCHFLLQCRKVKRESEVAQLCPTLSDPTDCSLPGSSVYGIFQARVLEWGAITLELM